MAPPTASPSMHAIGGSLGSALALLLFYPLERARIELQASASTSESTSSQPEDSVKVQVDIPEGTNSSSEEGIIVGGPISESGSDASWDHTRERYTETTAELSPSWDQEEFDKSHTSTELHSQSTKHAGLIQCLLKLKERGELYQGVGPVITTVFTSQFVFFFIHAYMKRVLKQSPMFQAKTASAGAILSLVSSCLAGVGNVLLTNPLWVANMSIMSGEAKTNSLWAELVHMYRTQGLKNLWNGTSASILLISNPVIHFFCYEQLKQARLHSARNSRKPSTVLPPLEAFVAGAMAKAIATAVTYPLQLAQTILRLKDNKHKGTMDCLVKLYERGGYKELFTGMRAKLLQTVLTAAFTFLTYEQILGAVQLALTQA